MPAILSVMHRPCPGELPGGAGQVSGRLCPGDLSARLRRLAGPVPGPDLGVADAANAAVGHTRLPAGRLSGVQITWFCINTANAIEAL